MERGSTSLVDDVSKSFQSSEIILDSFHIIWDRLCREVGFHFPITSALNEMKHLVLYEALDGSRSTLGSYRERDRGVQSALYALHLIHVLKMLGAQTCFIMVHTAYNRNRGEDEFHDILCSIEDGAPLIRRYAVQNHVQCSCICANENHELQSLFKEITDATRGGVFQSIFLFDYTEEWAMTDRGREIVETFPDIDVHIRHTKFQFSGGWIPGKMAHSTFLYSQNGSTYSNWRSDEIVVLASLSLLTKLLHSGEGLTKIYRNEEEIRHRYELREIKLFNKVIMLQDSPRKLFMMGSPTGVYQFYY